MLFQVSHEITFTITLTPPSTEKHYKIFQRTNKHIINHQKALMMSILNLGKQFRKKIRFRLKRDWIGSKVYSSASCSTVSFKPYVMIIDRKFSIGILALNEGNLSSRISDCLVQDLRRTYIDERTFTSFLKPAKQFSRGQLKCRRI